MGWFPDIFWLMGELALLLALSALIGLGIGWYIWRRRPSDAPAPDAPAPSGRAIPPNDAGVSDDSTELAVARSERDHFRAQRDRLRSQLSGLEALVGDVESGMSVPDPTSGTPERP